MKSSTSLLRAASCAVGALALLLANTACSSTSKPNDPANSHYDSGQHLPKPPSAGVGPQNAGPAGSQ